MTKVAYLLLRYEIASLLARGGTWFHLGFFFAVAGALPLIFRISSETFEAHSLAVFFWSAVILSSVIMLDNFFAEELSDGTFDILMTSDISHTGIVVIKCLAVWLSLLFPLFVALIVLPPMFGAQQWHTVSLAISLLLGSPALIMISCLIAALTLPVRSHHSLSAVLILPMSMPIALFGSSALEQNVAVVYQSYLLLGFVSLVYSVVVPPVAARLIREFS